MGDCLQMLTDHLIETTVMMALEYAIAHHPSNDQSPDERRRSMQSTRIRAHMAEVVIDNPTSHRAPARQL